MKFEQFGSFVFFNISWKFLFNLYLFTTIFNMLLIMYNFYWKVANNGSSYWYMFSNKKVLLEMRYF
jgi:hypothetical protein